MASSCTLIRPRRAVFPSGEEDRHVRENSGPAANILISRCATPRRPRAVGPGLRNGGLASLWKRPAIFLSTDGTRVGTDMTNFARRIIERGRETLAKLNPRDMSPASVEQVAGSPIFVGSALPLSFFFYAAAILSDDVKRGDLSTREMTLSNISSVLATSSWNEAVCMKIVKDRTKSTRRFAHSLTAACRCRGPF